MCVGGRHRPRAFFASHLLASTSGSGWSQHLAMGEAGIERGGELASRVLSGLYNSNYSFRQNTPLPPKKEKLTKCPV